VLGGRVAERPFDETFAEFPTSVNTYCGLFHFGIVDQLEHLPSEFLWVGPHEEAVLLPAGLAEAAQILRTAATQLNQQACDHKVATRFKPTKLEFWVKIDAPTFRMALLRFGSVHRNRPALAKRLGFPFLLNRSPALTTLAPPGGPCSERASVRFGLGRSFRRKQRQDSLAVNFGRDLTSPLSSRAEICSSRRHVNKVGGEDFGGRLPARCCCPL
jgi:hypothetical protein